MSDAVSALEGVKSEGFVSVEEIGLQGMIALRGDLSSAAIKNAATGVAGVDMPGRGTANCVGERGICWMSPDELLVLCPHAEVETALSSMLGLLKGEHALAVDVSDARACFRLKGDGVREVIAKLAPVDMAAGSFPVGSFRRTRFAQVAAAFWLRDETTAQVICFRSVAQYMFDLLTNAARPGSEVRHL